LFFPRRIIVTVVIRNYRPGEEEYVADLHERLYTEEYGWGPAFVTYAKKIAVDFPKRPANGREGLWIAEVEGEPAGSVMLCETEDPSVGQLRLFAVEKNRRRQGIGRALMEALIARAEEVGYKTLICGPRDRSKRPYGSTNASASG
jgi:GNAT superfamily N-acetyltransferase